MKVILAGYPKTGTKSMCSALDTLGYKTYDFLEHYWYHVNDWNKILTTGGTVEDFKRMYKDVDAVTDVPAFYFWEQIHEAFPDSKIILTLREEDSWYKSFALQRSANIEINPLKILKFMAATTLFNPLYFWRIMKYFKHCMRVEFGEEYPASYLSEMICRMKYRHHNSYVLHNAPKDSLLVYNVADGWEPLCRFLGKDIPDQSFPHKNVKASVGDELLSENPIAIANLKKTKFWASAIFGILTAVTAVVWFT